MRNRWLIPFCLLFASSPLLAQVGKEEVVQAPVSESGKVKDAFQGAWSITTGNKDKAEGMDQFRESAAVVAGLDGFRRLRNEALVRNSGTIPTPDRERLAAIAAGIQEASPNSFESHMADHYLQFPGTKAFQAVDRAKALGYGRVELIAPALTDAVRKCDRAELAYWAKQMKERGNVAPALYIYAKDLLASTNNEAILIVAGEMDAFPVLVLQHAGGERKDVLVVDQRLLADVTYRTRIWDIAQARGKVPEEQKFPLALAASTPRPVYLSLAMGATKLSNFKEDLYVTGLTSKLSKVPFDQISELESHWTKLQRTLEAGPLSQNYLLPAAILLKHYRANGDEANASRTEQAIRTIAQRTGMTNRLLQQGILEH